MRRAQSIASRSSETGPGVPGTIGTPAAAIADRAALLLPIVSIASGEGPMNAMPTWAQISAKEEFSARNP
jgi:hypothetical protein